MNNIINLQIDFDKEKVLQEISTLTLSPNKSDTWWRGRNEKVRTFFREGTSWLKAEITDTVLPEIKRLKNFLNADVVEVFNQKANSKLPRHTDFPIRCGVNILLSDDVAPITLDGVDKNYKIALIDFTQPHEVKAYPKDRLLLKFGWTTKSFEQVYEELTILEQLENKNNFYLIHNHNRMSVDYSKCNTLNEFINTCSKELTNIFHSNFIIYLQRLSYYLKKCKSYREIGPFQGGATAHALLEKLDYYEVIDIDMSNFSKLLLNYGNIKCFETNSLDHNLNKNTDFLFIDGLHEYDQVLEEAVMFSPYTNKYIMFHDTVSHPEVLRAINTFLSISDNWHIIENDKRAAGYMVIERK